MSQIRKRVNGGKAIRWGNEPMGRRSQWEYAWAGMGQGGEKAYGGISYEVRMSRWGKSQS